MRSVLTDAALCGWPPASVISARDWEDPRLLGATLRDLADQATEVLLVYFAGPAVIVPGQEPHGVGRELCLALPGTRRHDARATSLTYGRVREELLRNSRARMKVVILDCSYSARMLASVPGGQSDRLTGIRGAFVLAASDNEAGSAAGDDTAATPFTAALVETIRAGVPGGSAVLTLEDLFDPLALRLAGAGQAAPGQQYDGQAEPVPFTRNAAFVPPAGRPAGRRRFIAVAGIAVAAAATGSAIAASQSNSGRTDPGEPTGPVRLVGSGDKVNRVAFSPDGSFLIGGCGASQPRTSLLIWDITGPGTTSENQSGTPLQHGPTVNGVAFHRDGRRFATASDGGAVRLWDRVTGQSAVVCQHSPTAWDVAFSVDGGRLASSGSDRTVKISDVATRATRLTFPHPEGSTSGLAFSPDGRYLVTGCNDGLVRVWDAVSQQAAPRPARELSGHRPNAIPQITFRPRTPDTFATCSWDGTVRLWTLGSSRAAAVLGEGFFSSAVTAVAFHPDGGTLATACADSVYLWDVRKPLSPSLRPFRTLRSTGSFAVAYDTKGPLLATTSDDVVWLWRTG